MKLREIPLRERPTERMLYLGGGALSDTELLAILIGGSHQLEAAQAVIAKHGDSLSSVLAEEFAEIKGVGPATALRIRAAIELAKRIRYRDETVAALPGVRAPSEAAKIIQAAIGKEEREQFYVLYLNTRHSVVGEELLYMGSLNTLTVRTAEIFRGAVRRNCAAVIVGHNHPSGNVSPSPEDIKLTISLAKAGRLLELYLLDHIIVGPTRFCSIKERKPDCWDTY